MLAILLGHSSNGHRGKLCLIDAKARHFEQFFINLSERRRGTELWGAEKVLGHQY